MQTKTMLAIYAIATALLFPIVTYANLDISFSKPSGFYEQAFILSINTDQTPTVFYTMDGSDPATSLTRTLYNPSENILINQTTIIRVWAIEGINSIKKSGSFIFLDQVLQQNNVDVVNDLDYPAVWGTGVSNIIDPDSPNGANQYLVITQTADYEMDSAVTNNPAYNHNLIEGFKQIPTLSIATDKANLFDENTGIYMYTLEDGTVNASIEMINTDGTTAFCTEAGLSIGGDTNNKKYDFYKHSFQLDFDEQYGDAELTYELFGSEGAHIVLHTIGIAEEGKKLNFIRINGQGNFTGIWDIFLLIVNLYIYF